MQTKNFILDSDDPVDIKKDNVFKAVFQKSLTQSAQRHRAHEGNNYE
jgi:hypothetical protein